jgi:hypothetical protein
VLVKPVAIDNVTRALRRENVSYSIMIEDLQKIIDEENPPLDDNEVELQDRRGTYQIQNICIEILYNISLGVWVSLYLD